MQTIAPVADADLLAPVQRIRYRFEVWDGAAWQDLADLGGEDYLKSISISLGGAGMTPDPIAGTWSATIDNPDGVFHPLHPTSPYADLLRIGREVRISVGANYGAGAGTDYYWQRLIGFMDAPRFDHGSRTVEISGMDYMKLLADTTLADSLLVGESGSGSGSVGADDEVDGPTHWGRRAQLDSVASFTESGAELYVLGDAMDKVSPTNSIDGGWVPDGNVDFTSVGAGPGNWYGHMRLNAGTSGKVTFAGLLGLTAGDRYIIKIRLYKYIGGGWKVTLSEAGDELASSWVPTTGSWLTMYFNIIAPSTGNLDLEIAVQAASGTCYLNVDWLSIHKCIPNWNRYQLPVECNGPWYVALDGVQLTQGHRDADGHFDGWIYDEENHLFYFDEERIVDLGSENLWIYYYTDQILDNVVADILAICGLYVDRAAALADMDYTSTGITIGRVWFDSGGTALDAIRRICERANYRFWFSWDGTPCFKPAPVATGPSFVFAEPSHLEALSDFQDLETVHNHVTIEGSERAMFDMSREDQSKDVFKGEASDPASIAAYLEKAESIKNTLFQDQVSTDAMCAALVAADKDPKWFASLGLAFNPVPLELGDTIEWPLELEPAAEADSDSGRLIVTVEGIIRDIKLNDGKSTYNCEFAGAGYVSGSVSGSGYGSGSGFGSGSGGAFQLIVI